MLWGEGQLQGELDREDTWTMASVDPGLLLGQLREEQAELRRRQGGSGGEDLIFFGVCLKGGEKFGTQPKKVKGGPPLAMCDSPKKT